MHNYNISINSRIATFMTHLIKINHLFNERHSETEPHPEHTFIHSHTHQIRRFIVIVQFEAQNSNLLQYFSSKGTAENL